LEEKPEEENEELSRLKLLQPIKKQKKKVKWIDGYDPRLGPKHFKGKESISILHSQLKTASTNKSQQPRKSILKK